jgi:hypothetical protein
MPDGDGANLVVCASLDEARQVSARIRAGLKLNQATASRRLAASRSSVVLASGAGPAEQAPQVVEAQLAALHKRIDRLERALAAAGTFA